MNITPIFAAMQSATSATQTGSTPASSTSPNAGLDKTFMSLLLAELKTQDPTAPMDTTAMVGQLVSLNQLNELISINQALQTPLTPKTP